MIIRNTSKQIVRIHVPLAHSAGIRPFLGPGESVEVPNDKAEAILATDAALKAKK